MARLTGLIIGLVLLGNVAAAAGSPRKRIGLVLEGGGALGFAHIGVIEWLEAHHVPIDAVTGTSMGGLVGGLYSAGKTPAEIRTLVEDIDWESVLGEIPMRQLSYRRKEDRVAYPNRLQFGLKGGSLRLPSGLSSGYEVDAIISRALLPYYDLKSFDDLPIPFRCVATDMISGKQKVFDNGSLSQALRATMSIPAVFSPATDGSEVYTDGGALNNLPVDIAKQMGVDIVIAVYLDTGPVDRKSLDSLVGVAGRTVSIMISANEMRSIQMADILLTAKLADFDTSDFKKSGEIIAKGVEAARQKESLLTMLSLPDEDWIAYTAGRGTRMRTEVPVPQFLSITGTGEAGKQMIESAVRSSIGRRLNPDQEDRTLRLSIGEGLFRSLTYGLTKKDEETGLLIRAVEKSEGPPFLNLGLLIDGSDPNDVRFGLSARLTLMNLGGYGSEWRTDAQVGASYGLSTEFYRPLHAGSAWAIVPRAYASLSRFDAYQDRNRLAEYNIARAGGGIDLGYRMGRSAEIRIGEDVSVVHGTLRIGQPIVPNRALTVADSSVRFQYLGQDDVILPRSGVIQQTRLDWFSAGAAGGGYYSAQTHSSFFQPQGERGSFILTAGGGTTFGARQLGLQSFTLGGPFRMGAYGMNELLGNQYFQVQGGYSYRLVGLNRLVGDAVYAVALYELGKAYGNPQASRLPMDGLLAIVAKTALGPIYLGGSANGNRVRWWFGIGKIF